MLTVCWYSTPFTAIVVLSKLIIEIFTATARRWPCCCRKFFFWLAETRKSLIILRCIYANNLVLKYGSDIKEGSWLQLLFYFFVLMGIVASVIGMSFFQLCFRFQIEVFSYSTYTEMFAIGFQKWFDHGWIDFGFFCRKMVSFVDFISVWTEICKNCSIVSFLTTSIFFDA